jgi:transcriptional regulator with XRE-family HTH domain
VSVNSRSFDPSALFLRIGLRIVQLRDHNGWLQAELSRRSGIQPARLSRIERGKVKPRLDELVLLCRALVVSLDDLVFGTAGGSEEEGLLRTLLAAASPEDREAFRRLSRIFLIGYRQAGQTGTAHSAGSFHPQGD